jgi:UTP-glucose-1-phosphate uridylyltransferase
MQGTQQATYAENKEMAQEYPRQVIEEVEKATFAMQEEVKEAEAAVDACYQRQARRAGLGEMLPVGRPMMEGELDCLSELLGDGIGARARRRRREVEQMTLAEMEAELGGVQAEIKRRRSAGEGWLPLSLMLFLCISGHPVVGFTA